MLAENRSRGLHNANTTPHHTTRTQAENERSFKLLQEYLAAAKGGRGGDARDARSPQLIRAYRWVAQVLRVINN